MTGQRCVLKDLYREAAALGIELTGARVSAAGGFDPATWRSTDIDFRPRSAPGFPTSWAVLDLRRGNVALLPRPSPGCLDL